MYFVASLVASCSIFRSDSRPPRWEKSLVVWGRGNKSGLWTVFCLINALFVSCFQIDLKSFWGKTRFLEHCSGNWCYFVEGCFQHPRYQELKLGRWRLGAAVVGREVQVFGIWWIWCTQLENRKERGEMWRNIRSIFFLVNILQSKDPWFSTTPARQDLNNRQLGVGLFWKAA
jgi:hypothetical protein